MEAKGLETLVSLRAVSLPSVWLYGMLFSPTLPKTKGQVLSIYFP